MEVASLSLSHVRKRPLFSVTEIGFAGGAAMNRWTVGDPDEEASARKLTPAGTSHSLIRANWKSISLASGSSPAKFLHSFPLHSPVAPFHIVEYETLT